MKSTEDSRAAVLEFSNLPFVLFLCLQALDVATTMLGLRLGAHEASTFIRGLFRFGPAPALLMSKAICIALVTAAVASGRSRMLLPLNLWYGGLVAWNLVVILLKTWR